MRVMTPRALRVLLKYRFFRPLTAPDVQLPLQSLASSPVKRESDCTECVASSIKIIGA
jgi:hypothetical protein